ncbi:GBF-interacting protein [Heracleum sosnowskyi]|uniref:GBF-interacting protein n=1 Tax=Heracleum sosnowskyi TaxID=360622 RepID=A0AAD8H055_9APIA|nr:GBF-interacting protein [Heracleum sosnowskyi]
MSPIVVCYLIKMYSFSSFIDFAFIFLYLDPFHEVKRKRDKRKEVSTNIVHTASQPNKHTEPLNQAPLHSAHSDSNIRRGRPIQNSVNQGNLHNAHSDRNIRRGPFRNSLPDARVIREFRVVKDNRTNQNPKSEIKPPVQCQVPSKELEVQHFPESSSTTNSIKQKQPVGRHSSKSSNGITESQPRQSRDVKSYDKKELPENRRVPVANDNQPMETKRANDPQLTESKKTNDPQPNSATSPNNSVAGVYSSSSDPVHVPSPDSRPAANIGAIKREVGAVGARRLTTDISGKASSPQSGSSSNSHLGRDGRSSAAISKSSQPTQTSVHVTAVTNISVTRPFVNNQHVNRQHQSVGHQKASSQFNKEWKPKSSKKQSASPGVIGTPSKSASPPANMSKNSEVESTQLQDNLSRVNISENQNVIIAPHIRVSTTDRYRVTFGSMGTEFEPSINSGLESSIMDAAELTASVSNVTPESSADESSGSKQVELVDERASSPASAAVSEQQLTERKESSSPQDLDYVDVRLVRESSPSYPSSESQQHQDHPPPTLPIFSAYDPQTVYDSYFRSTADETARVQSLQFPHESINSHTVNSISSSVAMVQQPQLAQMYPQVHVSHYANLMPYRQFISPVYVPPMAVPAGYSSNPAYPHPSNGSSYLMMPGPGGSSHLPASGLKYGMQQFKPVPTGSPTGFGNFTSPNGYAINASGVGSATGLEDSSRLKYKDGNLYVPNPQAETSEIWMNPRDLPSMQSGSYYNMAGQAPHGTYMPSHSSHASFNAAAQSSHMQFPGMYHTPQPAGMPSPHHLSPAMGGNVGVGVAAGGPATQVNAYQQPQLGHMNWTGNF